MQLPETGYLRLTQIVGRPATSQAPAIPPIIPVSRSTWWAGVKSGRYPQPIRGLGPRITAWRAEDIRSLIAHVDRGALDLGRTPPAAAPTPGSRLPDRALQAPGVSSPDETAG